MHDWKDELYFKKPGEEGFNEEDDLRKFKVVDLIYDNHCAGYVDYSDGRTEVMYYLEMGESKAISLDLDFNGYMEMLLAAKAWGLWQRVIVNLKYGDNIPYAEIYESEMEDFKTCMPQLFPDFKWEDFEALYEKVRIK